MAAAAGDAAATAPRWIKAGAPERRTIRRQPSERRMLTLYHAWTSNCSRRVRFRLAEKAYPMTITSSGFGMTIGVSTACRARRLMSNIA
jgi:hypothetical protein